MIAPSQKISARRPPLPRENPGSAIGTSTMKIAFENENFEYDSFQTFG